jgi:hypothetical protein
MMTMQVWNFDTARTARYATLINHHGGDDRISE